MIMVVLFICEDPPRQSADNAGKATYRKCFTPCSGGSKPRLASIIPDTRFVVSFLIIYSCSSFSFVCISCLGLSCFLV